MPRRDVPVATGCNRPAQMSYFSHRFLFSNGAQARKILALTYNFRLIPVQLNIISEENGSNILLRRNFNSNFTTMQQTVTSPCHHDSVVIIPDMIIPRSCALISPREVICKLIRQPDVTALQSTFLTLKGQMILLPNQIFNFEH